MNNLLKKSVKQYKENQDILYDVQKFSNKIRAKSKEAIALLRRNNRKESNKTIQEAENLFKLINKTVKENKELKNQGFYREAVEEYIEAKTFFNFFEKSAMKIPDFVKVKPIEIISGICDFTGELVRRAITIASKESFDELVLYKNATEEVAKELTKIGFQGKLRQKYDEVERNLRKIEDILYDIKLKKQ